MRYLTDAERARVRAVIAEAGARADARAPLAWLQIEGRGQQRITLQTWPGGEELLLGTTDPQARRVTWLAR